jgi:hypothetical protein
MRVVFMKGKRELCTWTAYPPKRRPVTAVGGSGNGRCPIPHDLAQLVVERELGYRFGFWGCVAEGATFRTLVGGGRKRTRPGVEIIRAHVTEIDDAEHVFHRHVGQWLQGEETPARPALDEVLARWCALAEHESLEVEFPLTPRPRNTRRSRRRSDRA